MEWDDSLVLDQGVIDDTHREFVELLNRMADAPDAGMVAAIDEFIEHCDFHFGQEQRWMQELAFPPLACHVGEHDSVMEIAREVRKRAAGGETAFGRVLAQGVAEWFATHAASMDTVLALYMKERGYAPTAGE
jgi:hemerythrin-like metal-binding protein